SIRADHPVTRDDQRNGILSIREPDGPACRRPSDSSGQLSVGFRSARRNVAQCVPDQALERSPARVDGDVVDRSEVAVEIRLDSRAAPERIVRTLRSICRGRIGIEKVKRAHGIFAAHNHDGPNRRFDQIVPDAAHGSTTIYRFGSPPATIFSRAGWQPAADWLTIRLPRHIEMLKRN